MSNMTVTRVRTFSWQRWATGLEPVCVMVSRKIPNYYTNRFQTRRVKNPM